MRVMFPFLAVCFLSACGPPPAPFDTSGYGIIGGEAVKPRSEVAKHVVFIKLATERGEGNCTGVMTGANSILTAAHCTLGLKAAEIIFAADLTHSNDAFERLVDQFFVTTGYRPLLEKLAASPKPNSIKNWGDLAIFTFSGEAPKGYLPVPLGDGELHNGETVIIAGYGLTNAKAIQDPTVLRKAEVQVKKANYSQTEFVVTEGACYGDSGGPAFVRRGGQLHLAGITSRGLKGNCKGGAIYTQVAPFAEWIEKPN